MLTSIVPTFLRLLLIYREPTENIEDRGQKHFHESRLFGEETNLESSFSSPEPETKLGRLLNWGRAPRNTPRHRCYQTIYREQPILYFCENYKQKNLMCVWQKKNKFFMTSLCQRSTFYEDTFCVTWCENPSGSHIKISRRAIWHSWSWGWCLTQAGEGKHFIPVSNHPNNHQYFKVIEREPTSEGRKMVNILN